MNYDDTETATQGTGGMQVNHTPWSQEQAEKWALEGASGDSHGAVAWRLGFLAGMAKAAEMIEASSSIYCSKPDGVSELWTHNRCEGHDTHSAKLVGVRPIEGEK